MNHVITVKIHKSNILYLEPFAGAITYLCHHAKSKAEYIKLRFTFENVNKLNKYGELDAGYMICQKIELIEVTSDATKCVNQYNWAAITNYCLQHIEAKKLGVISSGHRPEVKLLRCRIINDIPDSYQLINDSQDVDDVFKAIGKRRPDGIDGLFILAGDGEYTSVYGFSGGVPALNKSVKRVI